MWPSADLLQASLAINAMHVRIAKGVLQKASCAVNLGGRARVPRMGRIFRHTLQNCTRREHVMSQRSRSGSSPKSWVEGQEQQQLIFDGLFRVLWMALRS